MKVTLKKNEYSFLVGTVLKEHPEFLHKMRVETKDTQEVDIYLDEYTADEIRELAADELVLHHFDENYVADEEGLLCELFIDKFFAG